MIIPAVEAHRSWRARRRHARAAGVLALLVSALVGCLTLDSTLKSDGSGSLEMTYKTAPNSTADLERKRFSSAHVTVDALTLSGPNTAVLKARFDDVTKLPTAEGFKSTTITRAREGEDERLTVTIINPVPAVMKDEGVAGPKITVKLPGKVREANHDAKVSDDTVTWSFSFVDWMKEKSTTLIVRYATAADAKAGDAPTDAAKDKGGPAVKPASH